MKRSTFVVLIQSILFFSFLPHAFAVIELPGPTPELAKGITFEPEDSSFSLRLGLILQPRTIGIFDTDTRDFQAEFFMRRLRLRFDGYALTKGLTYFVQLGFTNVDMESNRDPKSDNPGPLFDSFICWEFTPGTKLLFGQAKLPGNQSRQMSFSGLNFLERSYAENVFNTYRDIGFQLHNELELGGLILREYIALTGGEGRNRATADGGYCYTARVQALPLGHFVKSGELYEADIFFEREPKLAVGAAISYNDDAVRSRANLGGDLFEAVDITTYMADILFKYWGLSVFGEYYYRDSPDYITFNSDSSKSAFVYNGSGYSAQVSLSSPNEKIALAVRYSHVEPAKEIREFAGRRSDLSFGFTKFILNDKVKLQADATYYQEDQPGEDPLKILELRFNVLFGI